MAKREWEGNGKKENKNVDGMTGKNHCLTVILSITLGLQRLIYSSIAGSSHPNQNSEGVIFAAKEKFLKRQLDD